MFAAADNTPLAEFDAPGALNAATVRENAPNLVAALLDEQRDMTAVERFARLYEAGELAHDVRHAQAPRYQDLIPLTQPGPEEQFAFRVDLDACSGCKACVVACHQLNGLADDETWRSVGLLVGVRKIPPVSPHAVVHEELPVLKHVTTACHHCVEPACLAGCPTQAYDKDPTTGIVRHLDDQCIGCQYCLLMCPYEVPQYRPELGIVRKCDMCRQRLAADEAPACVQSCPNRAISIQIVRRDDAEAAASREEFLPDSPDPRQTVPTTTFVSRDAALGALRAADARCELPQHVPASLVTMLCLTQAAIGLMVVDELAGWYFGAVWTPSARRFAGLAAVIVGVVGIHAALLHLGRPSLAGKAWLGWRTSWLSREVIVFGAWTAAAGCYAATLLGFLPPTLAWAFRYTAIALGYAGVYCSVMIYAATGRTWWNLPRNAVRFFGTTCVLGLSAAACVAANLGSSAQWPLAVSAAVVVFGKTVWELAVLRYGFIGDCQTLQRTAGLLSGRLRYALDLRAVASCLAVGSVYLLAAVPEHAVFWTEWTFLAALVGELIERCLFFAAVAPSRMPGGIRA